MSPLILILLVMLVLLAIGGLPVWPHAQGWGYGPSGLISVLLVVIIVLLLVRLL